MSKTPVANLRAELRKCRHARRVCESRFHNIVNNSLDGILVVNGEGVILFTNPAAAVIFGKPAEELHGAPFGFPIMGADRAELDIPLSSGQSLVVEMRVAETEWDGQQAFLTQFRDITQRKHMEESLRLAAKVFENSTEGILILDARMRPVSGNRAFTQMTGFSPEEIIGKESAALWADRQGTVSFQKMFRSALAQRGRWQGEVCCHGKDGRMFPGWLSAVVVRDNLGIVTHYVVIFSDITERKANENALRLAAVVFEQSVEAVIVLDAAERFVSVNRSFTEITGYSPEEVIGHTPRLLKSGRQDAAFYRALWQQLKEYGHWQGEIWNRRKSGEIYPEWLSISTVRDERGDIANYIGIFSDITERKAQEAQINRLAFFDPLTHLPNRALLMDRLKQGLANADRNGGRVGVIFMDLDRFKEINDTQGHEAGDRVLIEVARRFQATLRQGETLARLGGDEFVVLIDSADQAAVAIVAERLQQALAKPIAVQGRAFAVGVSAGIAFYPEDGATTEELIKQADIAMYRAKQSGGGYRFYRAEMSRALVERIGLAERLRIALAAGALQLFYQPQVSLATGQLVGAEALLRWRDASEGWISPAKVVALAEEHGMMAELGTWVLRTACRQLRDWQRAGIDLPGRLAVNISIRELEACDFPDRAAGVLGAMEVERTQIELELTESSLLQNAHGALRAMHALREQRFSLAIDDFGIGYSSLSYLTRFPVQKLKIDASFVRNLLRDKQDYTLVQTIIAMGHSLGLRVIAEGIEESAHAELLLAMGCAEGQGYYYGPPEPAEVFACRWLGSQNAAR
jgi:diguanylate cyclase (GGDEF)-like protein/PAS domain S-box-containing protein